ncbi:MAG: hypothetical protein DBP01_08275 [gamma proteobacterium symbiont of Ctena orbiculata]|nr:MAG: hypothetical protein DBP01_08275 [gamma proteobacterium symbiont of Ctena orbiculata]
MTKHPKDILKLGLDESAKKELLNIFEGRKREIENNEQYPGANLEAYMWLYQRNKNPVYVWIAYKEYRDRKLDLPSWILDYFDKAADSIETLASNIAAESINIENEITKALGFIEKGKKAGRSNVITKYRDEQDLYLVSLVFASFCEEGLDITYACEKTAELYDISASQVRYRVDTYRKANPGMLDKYFNAG